MALTKYCLIEWLNEKICRLDQVVVIVTLYFAGAQFECNLGCLTVPDEVSYAFPQSLQGSASAIPQITSELFPYPF